MTDIKKHSAGWEFRYKGLQKPIAYRTFAEAYIGLLKYSMTQGDFNDEITINGKPLSSKDRTGKDLDSGCKYASI